MRIAPLLAALLVSTALDAGYSFDSPPSHPDWDPGIEAIQRNDWDAAIEHLSQVIRNEPDNADAHNALGFAYAQRGRPNDAMKHLREALRLSPGHRSAHENLGTAYLRAGNKAKAREHLAALAKACGRCDEYRALARAIGPSR